jgi:hypothetical protein
VLLDGDDGYALPLQLGMPFRRKQQLTRKRCQNREHKEENQAACNDQQDSHALVKAHTLPNRERDERLI